MTGEDHTLLRTGHGLSIASSTQPAHRIANQSSRSDAGSSYGVIKSTPNWMATLGETDICSYALAEVGVFCTSSE